MGFVNDLALGKEFETDIMDWFNKTLLMSVEGNKDKTGVDLLHGALSIEVKYDRLMRTTGNLFLEFECNGKESGLFKDEGATLLAYGDYNGVLIFELQTLRSEFPNLLEKFKVVNGGDGYRSKGLLLPIEEAKKLANGEIFIKK